MFTEIFVSLVILPVVLGYFLILGPLLVLAISPMLVLLGGLIYTGIAVSNLLFQRDLALLRDSILVTSTIINDCGEKLVPLGGIFANPDFVSSHSRKRNHKTMVRKTVLRMLVRAQRALPKGIYLSVSKAHRASDQERSSYNTGGIIDVDLVNLNGVSLDIGQDESKVARTQRKLLFKILHKVGLAN